MDKRKLAFGIILLVIAIAVYFSKRGIIANYAGVILAILAIIVLVQCFNKKY